MFRKVRYASESEPAHVAIDATASTQHGIVTRRQLVELGLGDRAISHRVRSGRLYRLHRGVYAVGHRAVSPYAAALAAVLACGEGAVLSCGSAGVLWGALAGWRAPLEVTAPGQHRHPRLVVHRSRTLTRRDRTTHYGIPVTSPSRTILDLAPRLDDAALARAVNDLRHASYLSLDDLEELLDRARPSRAVERLRYHVDARQAPTRSRFEDDFRPFAERYRLPAYAFNVPIAGHLADVWFPAERVVVELDGWDFHSDRAAFESDRDRDADLLAAGIPTVRITRDRIDNHPDREAARLVKILTDRTSSR